MSGARNPLIQCEPYFSRRMCEHNYSPEDGDATSTALEKENKGGGGRKQRRKKQEEDSPEEIIFDLGLRESVRIHQEESNERTISSRG